MNILALRHKARELYPNSRHNQCKWLRSHVYLYANNKHVLQGADYTLRRPTVLTENTHG